MKTPAATLHSLLAKARVAWRISTDDSDEGQGTLDNGPMLQSICRDLERLTGGAS